MKRYLEAEVDLALGLVDEEGKLVKEFDQPHSGPLRVVGRRSEVLQIQALEDTIWRVSFRPSAHSLDRTWVTGTAHADGVAGLEGWDREDLNRFETEHTIQLQVMQQDGGPDTQKYKLSSTHLTARLGGSDQSRHNPFKIEWSLAGKEGSFASDSALAAYAYYEEGSACHRMERRPDEEYYYGLGEVSGPLNRAGRRFSLECRDAMGYDAQRSDPLYKHFPFYITYNKKHKVAYGILYDQLCGGSIDLGQEISAFRGSFRSYRADTGFVDYFMILGPTIAQVVEKAGRLVGRPAVPPGWALGYVASTMTYADAPDAQKRLEAFPTLCERHRMPCDGFYLSSGYTMDNQGNRNVFTWNLDRVPEPEKMLKTFHDHKMRVIANVKPWLLEAHPLHNEMKARGAFFHLKDNFSESLLGWFWKGGPGTYSQGAYLDFTNPSTFDWWKQQLKENVLKQGVDAVWNDNNEYEIEDPSAVCAFRNLPIGVLGRSLHTLLMAKASWEALLETRPEKRPLVVSRSGCLGISRYAAQTWSGDNSTSFYTMKWNIPMSLGLGLCGWVGNGADIGGFTGDAVTPELFVRWIQLGIYMPRFSIHSSSWKASKTANATDKGEYNLDCTNEPWMFPEYEDLIRSLLFLRLRLRPLLLSLHLEAFLNSYPVMRPLVFHFADDVSDRSREESFEFTLGADLLVAPVLEQGDKTRQVYFPGDNGETCQSWCDVDSGQWYSGGVETQVPAPLQGRSFGAPVFLRNGSGLVLLDDRGDMKKRHVILACDPSNSTQVNLTWFEDPSPEQQGRMDSPADIITVDLDAVADEENGEPVVRVTQFEVISNPSHSLPFEMVFIQLTQGDRRKVTIDPSIHHRQLLVAIQHQVE